MINIKAQFDAKFLTTGTLTKAERVEYANGTKEFLKITLKSGEDLIAYSIFNTQKEPQRTRGLMTKLRQGDFLKASGTVSINEFEDRQGNLRSTENYTAFYTEHIEPNENPKTFVTIAGILKKKVDKEDMGGKEITIRVFDDYRKTNNEYTLSIDESMEEYFNDINEGDNISVTAQFINRAVADISTADIKSYGETINDVVPAGVKRKYQKKLNVIQGYILAEESELDDDNEDFNIEDEDVPF